MIRILSLCLLVLLGPPAAAQSPPEQKPAAILCVYNSKNYSEGATVCVQKAVMQTCTSDGTKATWTLVTDKDLSSRCLAPASRLSKYQQRAIWHRRNIAREITPATDSSPFCFYTDGKRFCE